MSPQVVPGVAGMLLTGGASRRMGTDKAKLVVAGTPLAVRTARVLAAVVSPVIEVGTGCAGVPTTREEPPGAGPLAAVAEGARLLAVHGHDGPAVVVATDLPRIDEEVVRRLAAHPSPGTVVPLVAGRPQWLAARWSAAALHRAAPMVAAGERRMAALAKDVEWLDAPEWILVLADVDTPDDLARAGMSR